MSLPFALSIHKFVNSVGDDVGFASIVAVAILILLYFAHARETATLRDRLDDAHQRIGGLEARIAQLMHAQAGGQRARPGAPVTPAPMAPVPVPSPVRPGNASIPSVRRVPSPATAAAGAAPAGRTATLTGPSRAATLLPAAPVGMGGPALASATKLVPDPAVAVTDEDPNNTMFVPAAAAAAAATNGQGAGEHTAVLSPATRAMPAAAAAAPVPGASPRAAATPPPRVQIGAEPAAATAAGGGRIRRIGGNPPPPSSFSALADEPEPRGRFSGRVLPLLIGGIAVVVIIAGLIVITNTGGSTNAPVSHNNSNPTGASLHKTHKTAAPFKPATVTVAVLNGTAQSGLAGDVGSKLARDGYKKGNITNAASQTQGFTFVYYKPGKANLTAAQHVAKALALGASRVRRAGNSVIQSCSISAAGTSLGSCAADVIVSVGQDRVNLASGG